MTSSAIKSNLVELKVRIRETEVKLKTTSDVDEGLQLQSDLNNLQALQTTLQAQLVEVERLATIAKKEREDAELDSQLADLEAQNHDLELDMQHRVRELAPLLEELLKTLKPLQAERYQLNKAHQELYLKRFNDWPKKPLVSGHALVSAKGLSKTEQVLEFALELLEAEKTGRGTTYGDVMMAVATQSVRYSF